MALERRRSFDEEDWNRPIMGSGARDTVLERRSLVSNDDGILDGAVPAVFSQAGTYEGKFYTRGCRGMIEMLQLYCIGDGADTITLRYSPHPCLGPFREAVITPAAAWAWQPLVIEEMWDYDSLFIWVYECKANVDWAYDAEEPYDGHESGDAGDTWADMATRPFIRVVYTGETPGDVPISGIINNIKLPNASAEENAEAEAFLLGVLAPIVTVHGAGYCDLVIFEAWPLASSHLTIIEVQCDGEIAFRWQLAALNTRTFNDDTQPISILRYAEDGNCTLMLTKMFEFRRLFQVLAQNMAANMTVSVYTYPTLLR